MLIINYKIYFIIKENEYSFSLYISFNVNSLILTKIINTCKYFLKITSLLLIL